MTAQMDVRVAAHFSVPAERVFDAWVDPALAAGWLFTTPASETHDTQLDVRIGGKWAITDRRGGVDYHAMGEYLEIAPPRRLAFTFGMPQFSSEFARVIVEIAPTGDGCVLTLTQDNVPAEHAKAIEDGWKDMFGNLAAILSRG